MEEEISKEKYDKIMKKATKKVQVLKKIINSKIGKLQTYKDLRDAEKHEKKLKKYSKKITFLEEDLRKYKGELVNSILSASDLYEMEMDDGQEANYDNLMEMPISELLEFMENILEDLQK